MRFFLRVLVFLLRLVLIAALVAGAVLLAVVLLRHLQAALPPLAFIALSAVLIIGVCLHLATNPGGWLFRRGEPGRRLGLGGWASLSVQLVFIAVAVGSLKMMLYAVQTFYPRAFWPVLAAVGLLMFGAAALADRKGRRRRR